MRVLAIVELWLSFALCAVMFGQARQDVDMIVSGGIVVTMDGRGDSSGRECCGQGRCHCGGGAAG